MIDLRLYALLDPQRAAGRDLAHLAREIATGGATLLQLRDKSGSTRHMIEEARAIKSAAKLPLIINDRADVAFASGADGVHVGWDDITVEDARRLLGGKAIIGLSIKTMQQAQGAPLHLLDYVCIGGVFATSSKDNPDPPIGVAGFKTLAAAIRARAPKLRVGAIAGIDAHNAAPLIEAGADGVAVISALSLAPDSKAAAGTLRGIVDAAIGKRSAA